MSNQSITYSMATNLDIIGIGLEQMNLLVVLASRQAGELTDTQLAVLLGDLLGRIEELEETFGQIQAEVRS